MKGKEKEEQVKEAQAASSVFAIRPTRAEEVEKVMEIFEAGKRIMRKDGNLKQWTGGYPSREVLLADIANGSSYVCTDKTGNPVGTFAFIRGIDPTYLKIYNGAWIEDTLPYGTIHRLASTEESRGVAAACIEWCYRQVPNLRADTHRDNRILQHILTKHGFRYCGIIYLLNGDERLAYQRIEEYFAFNASTLMPVK